MFKYLSIMKFSFFFFFCVYLSLFYCRPPHVALSAFCILFAFKILSLIAINWPKCQQVSWRFKGYDKFSFEMPHKVFAFCLKIVVTSHSIPYFFLSFSQLVAFCHWPFTNTLGCIIWRLYDALLGSSAPFTVCARLPHFANILYLDLCECVCMCIYICL